MSETVRFPQLNHTNYAKWALPMEAILIHGGFWDLITGDEKLAEGGSDDIAKVFRKREAQCKAEIVLRVTDSQLSHMADRSPMVIWNSLANREYDGQPWGFLSQPAPIPVKTHTRGHGYGYGHGFPGGYKETDRKSVV